MFPFPSETEIRELTEPGAGLAYVSGFRRRVAPRHGHRQAPQRRLTPTQPYVTIEVRGGEVW